MEPGGAGLLLEESHVVNRADSLCNTSRGNTKFLHDLSRVIHIAVGESEVCCLRRLHPSDFLSSQVILVTMDTRFPPTKPSIGSYCKSRQGELEAAVAMGLVGGCKI